MCLSLSETATEEQRMKTMTATETQNTKVRRTQIVPCLTCPLCNKFFREATTISECLHTFCKECIWKKFSDERKTHCPICDKDLGCFPLDRLRPDNSLQDLRDKIFPNEEKSSKTPERVPVLVLVPEPKTVPSFPLPTNSKKKERSLSSLSTSSAKLSSHSCIVERRAKAAAKYFLDEQESALAAFQLEKRSAGKKHGRVNGVEILEEDKNLSRTKSAARKKSIPKEYIPSTSQPQPQKVAEDNNIDQEHCQIETENVTSEIENQKTSLEPDLNQQKVPNEETSEKNAASWKRKAAIWFLMEAVENAKSLEPNNMPENANISVPVESCNNDSNPTKIMAATDQNEATLVQPEPIKIKGLRIKHQRVIFTQDLNVPAEPVPVNVPEEHVPVNVPAEHVPVKVPAEPVPVKVPAEPVPANVPAEPVPANVPAEPVPVNVPAEPVPVNVPAEPVPAVSSSQRITPIWFSLVASEEKDVRASLPQIPSCYLRVKDVNLPVSFIKKYVVKKLGLAISEAEVELSLRGKPLSSSLQLKHIAEIWLETMPKSEKIHSFVGDSAKEFVMVLSYSRKVQLGPSYRVIGSKINSSNEG